MDHYKRPAKILQASYTNLTQTPAGSLSLPKSNANPSTTLQRPSTNFIIKPTHQAQRTPYKLIILSLNPEPRPFPNPAGQKKKTTQRVLRKEKVQNPPEPLYVITGEADDDDGGYDEDAVAEAVLDRALGTAAQVDHPPRRALLCTDSLHSVEAQQFSPIPPATRPTRLSTRRANSEHTDEQVCSRISESLLERHLGIRLG